MSYIEAIRSKNWQLLDVTNDQPGNNWDDYNTRIPAARVDRGHTYLFTPQPHADQTVKDAYVAVGGVGSCLRIADAKKYMGVYLRYTPELAVFSRMTLSLAGVVWLYTPPSYELPHGTDQVYLHPETAESIFEQEFDITTLAEVTQKAIKHREHSNPN